MNLHLEWFQRRGGGAGEEGRATKQYAAVVILQELGAHESAAIQASCISPALTQLHPGLKLECFLYISMATG